MTIPSFRDLNKVVVGLVGLALTGAVIAAAFAVGTLGLFEHRFAMDGVFADSGGLKNGAPVRVAGIQVGEVTAVTPDFRAGQVVISWTVNSGVHVGPDTRAEVGTSTLLGGDFLRLTSTEGGPSLESMPRVQRRIPLERTKSPYTVINAFGDVTRQINTLDVHTINQVVDEVSVALQHNTLTAPQVVDNLARLGDAVAQRQDQLDQLIANSQQLTSTLASRDQQLGTLIDQASALLDVLNARHDQLAALLGSSSDVVTQLADLIETKRAQIDSLLHDVHTTLGAVQQELPAINQGLSDAGPTLLHLAAVVGPNAFNIEVTGVGPGSIDNFNKLIDTLLGPPP